LISQFALSMLRFNMRNFLFKNNEFFNKSIENIKQRIKNLKNPFLESVLKPSFNYEVTLRWAIPWATRAVLYTILRTKLEATVADNLAARSGILVSIIISSQLARSPNYKLSCYNIIGVTIDNIFSFAVNGFTRIPLMSFATRLIHLSVNLFITNRTGSVS